MHCLRHIFLIIILLLATISCKESDEKEKLLEIVFTGDLLLDRGVRECINYQGVDGLFHQSIDSLFNTCDYVIANLECPATLIHQPINKKFIFRAEPQWLESLQKHGITHLNMANNHTMDQGRKGLSDTYNNILRYHLVPLGYGKNAHMACEPFLLSAYPRKVYLLSSLQVPSENWTYFEYKPCICEESFHVIAGKIKMLKKADRDNLVIVQLHWGAEHTFESTTEQKQQAQMLIDAGADCIIGHHTHTVQTVEYINKVPVFYSLGNFIFDQSKPANNEGLLVKLKISANSVVFDTIKVKIDKCRPAIAI
ncbi:MAG: CapA family protein [Bacteroidales bacterium]|nr:CapA family protein [Bacteroidales bacterium]